MNYCLLLVLSVHCQCQQYRESTSVLENQPAGTFVLQVHAVDADEGSNGRVTYGFMHKDSTVPAFSIHPDTGTENTELLNARNVNHQGVGFNPCHTKDSIWKLNLKSNGFNPQTDILLCELSLSSGCSHMLANLCEINVQTEHSFCCNDGYILKPESQVCHGYCWVSISFSLVHTHKRLLTSGAVFCCICCHEIGSMASKAESCKFSFIWFFVFV